MYILDHNFPVFNIHNKGHWVFYTKVSRLHYDMHANWDNYKIWSWTTEAKQCGVSCNYLRQTAKVMFSSLPGLPFCLSLCLLETIRNNACTDFHGILRTGAAWNKGHSGTFGDRLFYAWINCFTLLRQARRRYALSKCFMFTLCLGYTPIMYLFWKRYIPTCWNIRYPIWRVVFLSAKMRCIEN